MLTRLLFNIQWTINFNILFNIFWNKLQLVGIGKTNNLKVFDSNKNKGPTQDIQSHLSLTEANLSLDNNYII